GRLDEAHIAMDRETQRSRGFGFVSFADPRDAQAAADGMNDTELDGRRIYVVFSKPG
ncbi:hypothetical protein M885DRAFT_418507, partial [Pelagophyceae sp. CCMP2097]